MSGVERLGSVWCRYQDDPGFGVGWHCYWDREPDGPPELLERVTGLASLADALTWARERAPSVYVYPEDPEATDPTPFWAGEGPAPDGLRVLDG